VLFEEYDCAVCVLWTKSRTKNTDMTFSQTKQNKLHSAKAEKLGKMALQF